MLTIALITLLTLGIFGSIFLAVLLALYKHPPVVEVSLIMPPELTLVTQVKPANVETDKPTEVPIPEKVLDYINLESDEWAQNARKRRARSLYSDCQDWNIVFRQLQLEDTPEFDK